MTAIRCIHWGPVGRRSYGDEPGALFAVWPEPVNADACFTAAGFERFDDPDDAWDAEFVSLLQRVVETFGQYGSPRIIGQRPVWKRSLKDRLLGRPTPEPALHEHLALVAGNDQLDPVRVEFSAPVRAAIFVSDGHPIVWSWLHASIIAAWQEHLLRICEDRPRAETSLTWEHLLPQRLEW